MTTLKTDISDLEDIKLLVDTFYGHVREDSMLAGIFNSKLENRWSEHLEKMYRFWQTVLLEEHTYHGSPFVPHAKLPIDQEHFDRWIQLFTATVESFFEGPVASRAIWQGQRMAEMFQSKLAYYKNNNITPLL